MNSSRQGRAGNESSERSRSATACPAVRQGEVSPAALILRPPPARAARRASGDDLRADLAVRPVSEKVEVAEQRRDYTALRNALPAVGFEHHVQQVHHVGVINPPRHLGQQPVMPDIVKGSSHTATSQPAGD